FDQLLLARVCKFSGHTMPETGVLQQHLCDIGEFLCHDHVTCVSENWLCDGEPDCPDDSDESLDTCK
uniref:Uncharacterized protein n=1 Tax=Sphenodon punctatus TaxID=8508 RepID=A0A8D0GVD5_SPHPU